MACDATGMDHVRAKQTVLGEEPIYCAAYDDDEDILYLGADESLSPQARVARRLRYEDHALRYLRGQRPRLLSAALQGPFDRASGWRNPWLPENQVSKTRETIQDNPATDIPTHQPPKTVAIVNTPGRFEPEMLRTKAHQTPATKNSVQCHLPSPDSHRELELADDLQFDREARSRIQAWARNIPTDTFERDEFWAPDDGTGSVSDTSAVSKRPAGKEWLRSKLNKRMRTGYTPFATLGTPTPASVPPIATSATVSSNARRTSQINVAANSSFEHNTPASSPGQRTEESAQRPSSRKIVDEDIPPSKNEPSRHNVAVKASALRKAVIKQPRQASKTLSRNASHEWPSVLSTKSPRLVTAPVLQTRPAMIEQHSSQVASTSSNSITEPKNKYGNQDDNPQQHISPKQYNDSFKSHLDRSFQHKSRTTKPDAPKLANDNIVTRQSQPTQTGTPESEDYGSSVPTQRQAVGTLGLDYDNLMHQPLGQIEELSKDHHERKQDDHRDSAAPRRIIARSSNATNHGHGKIHSDLEENLACGDTILLERGVDHDNIQDGAPQPSASLDSTSSEAQIKPKDSAGAFQSTSPESLAEVTINNNTPIADRMVIDTNTTCQTTQSVERFEDLQFSVPGSEKPKVIKSSKPAPRPRPARPVSEPPLSLDTIKIPVRAVSHFELANSLTESAERCAVVSINGRLPEERQDLERPIGNPSFITIAHSTTLMANQDTSFPHVPITAVNTASQDNSQSAAINENMLDNMSDAGHSVIMVPLSQAEWAITETADVAKRTVEDAVLQLDPQFIKIEPAAEREGEFTVSDCTIAIQSPWVVDDHEIKVEPVEEEEWVSCSQPISLTSSPADMAQQHESPPSQQGSRVRMVHGFGHVAGLQASQLLQHSISAELSPLRMPEEQQSPWNISTSHIENANHIVVPFSSQNAHLQPSSVNELSSPNTALQQVPDYYDLASKSAVLEKTRALISSDQLATPFQLDARRPTPEPNLSIKSFATFNTPSPIRRRASKHRIVSGDRLPSTQLLTNAVNSNPWSSVRSSFRSSIGSRSHLRVSFAPLPDEDNDGDESDKLLRSAARIAASPPPQSTPDIGDEDAGGHFHKHLEAVRQKTMTNKNTPNFRLAPRLLPSESQQVPLSPEIGMMAQAFKEADVIRRSLEPEIAEDEVPDEVYDESKTRMQSPWRIESQSEGVDDVADVLQNLDDFLNPRWDVEAEMDKAQVIDGIENQRRDQSPGLFGANAWA